MHTLFGFVPKTSGLFRSCWSWCSMYSRQLTELPCAHTLYESHDVRLLFLVQLLYVFISTHSNAFLSVSTALHRCYSTQPLKINRYLVRFTGFVDTLDVWLSCYLRFFFFKVFMKRTISLLFQITLLRVMNVFALQIIHMSCRTILKKTQKTPITQIIRRVGLVQAALFFCVVAFFCRKIS